jgi:hypothetical protein
MKVHVETLDGLFRDLELTISEDGLDIANTDSGAHSYIIPWQEITAVDAGNLHPYKVNKIAIECRPRGRKTMLVKVYVPALPDVDALAQELLRRGMKAKHGRIPTPLHHPRMLRYYTPALRYALTIISKFYRFLTFFGLVCQRPLHVTMAAAVRSRAGLGWVPSSMPAPRLAAVFLPDQPHDAGARDRH